MITPNFESQRNKAVEYGATIPRTGLFSLLPWPSFECPAIVTNPGSNAPDADFRRLGGASHFGSMSYTTPSGNTYSASHSPVQLAAGAATMATAIEVTIMANATAAVLLRASRPVQPPALPPQPPPTMRPTRPAFIIREPSGKQRLTFDRHNKVDSPNEKIPAFDKRQLPRKLAA